MESSSMAAQLGLAPGYRFVPRDEEVVRLHLLPSILKQPQPPSDIILDDPLSAPPWALLEKHGRKREAFFFAKGQALNAKGKRQKRTCAGHGTWQGQGKSKSKSKKRTRPEEDKDEESKKRIRVSVGSSTQEIEWEKYGLNFHERGVAGSTGWVMHEYFITSPSELAESPMRVYCIRNSGHGKNAKKRSRDADDWGSDCEDVGEADDATLATTWCAAEEDPAFTDDNEYPLASLAEYIASLSRAVPGVVNAVPADGTGAGAGNDQDLPTLVEDNATTCRAAEEDPALFIGEYPLAPQADISLPVMVANVVNANPADGAGAGAGAGNNQDLPAVVEDDDWLPFLNALSDLGPGFDLSP